MNNFLHLNPQDNVLVALRAAAKDSLVQTALGEIQLACDISLAHKVAAQRIKKGDDILKYGMVIGRATQDILPGAHVHVHNLESKYTATHYRKEDVA